MTVSPREAAAGALQRYCIRVPSEKPIATIGLEVEFPPELEVAAIEAPAGWRGAAHKDRRGRIASAGWEGGKIPPRSALGFGVVARNPAAPATLVWKAIQKYEDSSEVHWVGPAEAQFPAAVTRVEHQRSESPPRTSECSREVTPSSGEH